MTDETKSTETFEDYLAAYDGSDREMRSMIERRAAIQALTEYPGWVHYRDFIQSRVNKASERIVLGRLSEEDYRRLSGWCAGMVEALNALEFIDQMLSARIDSELEERAAAAENALSDGFSDYDSGQAFPAT